MSRNKEDIIHHLATKHGLPLKKVKEIVEYQFKVVSLTMREGEFKTVRLPYFGKYVQELSTKKKFKPK